MNLNNFDCVYPIGHLNMLKFRKEIYDVITDSLAKLKMNQKSKHTINMRSSSQCAI